ncbi:hypothetical protein EYC84_007735 [Monilinia fructicola]|uniref:Uncharacterized protein n=1 Tax=Monilinia fructicola TaxID=38448 RepID=A0A5M9JL82_MONFR|nr:hypothetical protein EYC84_007735 [Monilinia fructicola]
MTQKLTSHQPIPQSLYTTNGINTYSPPHPPHPLPTSTSTSTSTSISNHRTRTQLPMPIPWNLRTKKQSLHPLSTIHHTNQPPTPQQKLSNDSNPRPRTKPYASDENHSPNLPSTTQQSNLPNLPIPPQSPLGFRHAIQMTDNHADHQLSLELEPGPPQRCESTDNPCRDHAILSSTSIAPPQDPTLSKPSSSCRLRPQDPRRRNDRGIVVWVAVPSDSWAIRAEESSWKEEALDLWRCEAEREDCRSQFLSSLALGAIEIRDHIRLLHRFFLHLIYSSVRQRLFVCFLIAVQAQNLIRDRILTLPLYQPRPPIAMTPNLSDVMLYTAHQNQRPKKSRKHTRMKMNPI